MYFMSFTILTLAFIVLEKVKSLYHFIFIWILLLRFILDNEFQLQRRKTFILFYVVSLGLCCFNLIMGKAHPLIQNDYKTVATFTQREKRLMHIINFDGWNHGITRKLDNPNHHNVTLIDPRNTPQFKRLITLAKKLHLPIIEVSNQVDWGYPIPMTPEKKWIYSVPKDFK